MSQKKRRERKKKEGRKERERDGEREERQTDVGRLRCKWRFWEHWGKDNIFQVIEGSVGRVGHKESFKIGRFLQEEVRRPDGPGF